MLYQHILSEHQKVTERIQSLKSQLNTLPPGKLICCSHGRYVKWYQSDSHQKSYIPKTNRALAEQLAKKKYLALLLKDLENEKRALESYVKYHSHISKADQLLTEPSECQKLLTPFFSPSSQQLSDWMNAPYERNQQHPENLIHKTISGNMVRSKSELLIDVCLRTHNIPFRYECALHIDDTTVYPDFTLLHPLTHQILYWEHFGMMDNPTYANHAASKIKLYASCGIIPGIHLITTYETRDFPLNTDAIEKLIEYYFS